MYSGEELVEGCEAYGAEDEGGGWVATPIIATAAPRAKAHWDLIAGCYSVKVRRCPRSGAVKSVRLSRHPATRRLAVHFHIVTERRRHYGFLNVIAAYIRDPVFAFAQDQKVESSNLLT